MSNFNFGNSGSSIQAPLNLKFEWAIRDFYLGQKNSVKHDVLADAKKRGKVIKGHANQTYSYLKTGIPNGIETQDPEILTLCAEYGIDPAKSMQQQDRVLIKSRVEAKIAERAAVEKFNTNTTESE